MRLAAIAHLLHDPDDGRYGGWSQEELEQMNALFIARMEAAFASGLESPASARQQMKLPTNSARFVSPPPPDGLLRSPSSREVVFVARG